MKLVTQEQQISRQQLQEMAEKMFHRIVKTVIDVKQEVMVVDAGMHADEEAFLIETGSLQENLWGINLHPDKIGNEFIEFD